MKQDTKPTSKVILFTSKELSDGKYSIKLRITHKRIRKYYSLGISVTKDRWINIINYNSLRAGNLKESLKEYNDIIALTNKKAEDILKSYINNNILFSFTKFEQDYFTPNPKDIIKYVEDIIKDLLNQEYYGNYRIYSNLLSSLKRYSNNNPIYFEEITIKWLKSFKLFISTPIKANKDSISNTTISIRLRTLRSVYNKAIEDEIITGNNYPFKGFKISAGNTKKRALSKSDILKLYNYQISIYSKKWYAKTYFLLAYLLQGINFIDMVYLKWNNIKDNRIVYQRRKTINTLNEPKEISIKLTEEINNILNLFKEINPDSEYILPIITKVNYNKKQLRDYILDQCKKNNNILKTIGKELDINLNLTSYVARHSYATILKKSNIPTSVISQSLGHSSESVTQNYLANFENEVIDEANKNLL